MSACTPYPATSPCQAPPMPPVLVNPYGPTPTPLVPAPVTLPAPVETSGLAVPDDELSHQAKPVPEPSALLLTALALACLTRFRRPTR